MEGNMKNKERVPKYYKEGSADWKAEFNMLLDDGITCGDCNHNRRCETMFGGDNKDTSCQFHPNRFSQKK